MENFEATILADTFEKARSLSRFYISLLKEVDPHHQFEFNGVKLNSVAWIVAHLSWSENFLLLEAIGGAPSGVDWLNHYQFGSDGSMHEPDIDVKSLLDDLKKVHEHAMVYVRSLTESKLETENKFGLSFGSEKSNRAIIQHAIRHEGCHAGHLGWLCKLHKIQTV